METLSLPSIVLRHINFLSYNNHLEVDYFVLFLLHANASNMNMCVSDINNSRNFTFNAINLPVTCMHKVHFSSGLNTQTCHQWTDITTLMFGKNGGFKFQPFYCGCWFSLSPSLSSQRFKVKKKILLGNSLAQYSIHFSDDSTDARMNVHFFTCDEAFRNVFYQTKWE